MPQDTITTPTGGTTTAAGPTETPGNDTKSSGVAHEFEKAKTGLRDGIAKASDQATGKAREFAEQGKAKAHDTLDEIVTLINDAAGTVDERLGEQYGDYARQAAETVSGFSDTLKQKSVDDLVQDAREIVRQSPAIAVGAAAAAGFVLARLVKAGVDANDRIDG